MPKLKSSPASIDSIGEQRARLQAQLAELEKTEKRLRDAERDAGRKVLVSALGRVKIMDMSRDEARAIATVLGTRSAAEIVAALGSLGAE